MVANRRLDDDALSAVGRGYHFLVFTVDPELLGDEHARADDDGFRSHRQHGRDLPPGTDATADHDRDVDYLGPVCRLDEAADLIYAGMSATLRSDDAHRINAKALSCQRISDGGHFVDDLDVGVTQDG